MEKEEKTSIEDEEEFEPDQEKENFDEVQVKYEVLSEEQERQQELAKADYMRMILRFWKVLNLLECVQVCISVQLLKEVFIT